MAISSGRARPLAIRERTQRRASSALMPRTCTTPAMDFRGLARRFNDRDSDIANPPRDVAWTSDPADIRHPRDALSSGRQTGDSSVRPCTEIRPNSDFAC